MQTDLEQLPGKTAFITGGARRLGAAIARRFAREGIHLVVHYRSSRGEAEVLADELRSFGVRVALLAADLADGPQLEQVFAEAVALAGAPIDFLVNSASIFPEDAFDSVNLASVNENVAVNAWAPFTLARAFGRQQRPGAIVNLLDTRVLDYDRLHLSYHLSKRMFAAMHRILAEELAPLVRVNAIAPGLVLPPEGKDIDYLEQRADTNLLRRYGSPDGIAEAAVFLLRSGFVTGQTIYVDGGRHMRGCFYDA